MPVPPKPDPREIIFRHLARYGVRDKDAVAAASAKGTKPLRGKIQNGRRVLDLHGLTVDAAIATLRDEIDRCASHGVAELLVIHGYGLHSKPGEGGALKTSVKQYLEELSDAGKIRSYVSAIPREGGEGATVVRVRQR
jgi:DNA-nicking Smr family endonuclease